MGTGRSPALGITVLAIPFPQDYGIAIIGFPSKVSAMGGHGSIQLYLKVIHSIIDYDAVNQNTVINPGEYQEMLDFTQGIAEKINGLPESEYKTSLTDQSQQLSTLMGAIKSDVRC